MRYFDAWRQALNRLRGLLLQFAQEAAAFHPLVPDHLRGHAATPLDIAHRAYSILEQVVNRRLHPCDPPNFWVPHPTRNNPTPSIAEVRAAVHIAVVQLY